MDKPAERPEAPGLDELLAEIRQRIRELEALPDLAAGRDAGRARTADLIARAKEEWEATVDSLKELVFLLDADGRVQRGNRALEEWGLGAVDQVKGRDVHELLHGPCRGECPLAALLARARTEKEPIRVLEKELWDEPLGRHLAVQIRPLAARRRRPAAAGRAQVLVIEDIGPRKRLGAAADAEAALHRYKLIFSGLRHEIGNPLNSIKVTLSVLRERLETLADARCLTYVDRSQAEVERIEALLQSLRQDALYERLQVAVIEIAPLITDFCAACRPSLQERAIALSCRIAENAGRVQADAQALTRILHGVVAAAADAAAGQAGAEITVALSRQGPSVLVAVGDNGWGGGRERAAELALPLAPAAGSSASLGAVLIQDVLQMMDGEIGFGDRPGGGAEARIRLKGL